MTAESRADAGPGPDRPHEVEVLVVDADTQYLIDLLDRLDRDTDALTVHTSRDVDETVERIEAGEVDCLVCTYDAGRPEGLELLDYVRKHHVEVPVVLLPARETTVVDSRNLAAEVDAVFDRDEAVEEGSLGPHLVNVVEQQRTAAAAERRAEVTDLMGRVARDVAGAKDAGAVERSLVDRLADADAFDGGWVGEVAADGSVGEAKATAAPDAVPGLEPDGPEPAIGAAVERAVEHGRPQVVEAGEYSHAVVPVAPEAGTDRAMAVAADSRFAFEQAELDLLDELGQTVSRTLDTVATRESLESRVDDLELVEDLVEDLAVGVVVYDADGRVERANEAFAAAVNREGTPLPGTPVWEVLAPRSAEDFEAHWAATGPEEPTVESATVGGAERELVTTRVEAEGEPYNVTLVVDGEEDGPMDRAFAETLSYEFRHWFDLAQQAVDAAREERDPEQLRLVDELVERMQDAVETEVERVAEPDADPELSPQPLGEVAGVAWNHVLGEAGRHEVRGSHTVVAHRGLLMRLFEHLFRTLLQYAEAATAVDVGVTRDGFYVEDDGSGLPHPERAYVRGGPSPSDVAAGAGILVARRAARRMGWSFDITRNEAGGTRFVVGGADLRSRDE